MTARKRISALLLFSTILRGCYEKIPGGLLEKALNSADEALHLAAETGDPYLIGKCHYHRGICFLYFDFLADARWSFVLASNTDPDYNGNVDVQLENVELKIASLPAGDHRRTKLYVS